MPKILIVDDKGTLLSSLVWALREEYEVRVARDGLKALRLAQLFMPDVVLTDFKMPGLDGLELLAVLRRLPKPPQVILFSALLTGELEAQAKARGAAMCLGKPFDLKELKQIIRALAFPEHP